jgi:hypothetical protein
MLGVVRQASWGLLETWTTLHAGSIGDARGATSNAVALEFLGDYNSAWATNSGVFGVWNDARDGSLCPVINTYRQSLLEGNPTVPPAPQNDCPDTFGASSIYGGWYTP